MNTHELNDLVDRQHERIGELETERDALAAQTKRCLDLLTHVLKQFEKHELGEELDSEEDALAWAEKARAAISDTPTTSLARLKSQWQAEVLEDAADSCHEPAQSARGMHDTGVWLRHMAAELRHQAEGEGS